MTGRQKIADRIRKLMAKASGTENENEASTFAEKAQAMLLEHNLTMDDVREEQPEDTESIIDAELTTPPHRWRFLLATGVSHLYMCEHFYDPDTRTSEKGTVTKFHYHVFIGTRANVAVAKLMFVYLMRTVDRLAHDGARKLPEKERSPYRGSFRDACVRRLRVRMAERVEEAKDGGVIKTEDGNTLPALLSMFEKHEKQNQEKMQKHGIEKVPAVIRKPKEELSQRGAIEGDAAGREIGLDGQVQHDKQKRIG